MRTSQLSVLAGAALTLAACLGPPLNAPQEEKESVVSLPGDSTCSPGSSLHGPDMAEQPEPVDADARFPWDQADPTVADGFDADDGLFVLGGVPGDGIPALDEPCFAPAAGDVDWLEPRSPVLSIVQGEQARAYPLAILHFHEIVNDVVDGEPVAVTYCPLCNSGIAFERSVDGRVLEFAVSGRLHRSNLVMYDRQTRGLWLQFTGEAIAGEPFVGRSLTRVPTWLISWSEFTDAHPDGWVLTRETGHERDYDHNPYAGFADAPFPEGHDPYFGSGPQQDTGLHAQDRVVGIAAASREHAVAVPLANLSDVRQTTLELDGEEILVVWAPGNADALDTARIDDGNDVGQVGTYLPQVTVEGERRSLTIRPDPADERRFFDEDTGSTWNVLGQAIDGPLEGARLTPVERAETFWSVWFSFHPTTELHWPA